MTKADVFRKYRDLKESHNIRAYGSDGREYYGFDLVDRDLEMDHNFEVSNHWMAYRDKYPLYYHEFFFADGKLIRIITYIRFFEPF